MSDWKGLASSMGSEDARGVVESLMHHRIRFDTSNGVRGMSESDPLLRRFGVLASNRANDASRCPRIERYTTSTAHFVLGISRQWRGPTCNEPGHWTGETRSEIRLDWVYISEHM